MTDKINHRQLMAATFLGLMSPTIRLLPRVTSQIGGRASWISVFVAAAAGILFIYIVYWLMKNRQDGHGLAEMLMSSLGRPVGIIVCGLAALWITAYAGFMLRSGSERMISCVYPHAEVVPLALVMAALAVMGAQGRVKSIVGAGTVFAMIVAGVMIFSCAFAVPEVRIKYLLPIARQDIPGIAKAAVPVFDVLNAAVYYLFLIGHADKRTVTKRRAIVWILATAAAVLVVIVVTVGTFSAEVAKELEYPFFTLIRNVHVFKIMERFEAIVIAVWICADFVYVSVLLMAVRKLVTVIIGKDSKVTAYAAGVAAVVVCFALGGSAFELNDISSRIVPAVSTVFTVALIPLSLVVGKLRKKL